MTAWVLWNTLLALPFCATGAVAAWAGRPAIAHVAWLLALLRLVAPPLLPVSAPRSADLPAVAIVTAPLSTVERAIDDVVPPGSPGLPAAGLVWGLGSLVCAGVAARRVLAFARLVEAAPLAEPALRDEVRDLGQALAVGIAPTVRTAPGAFSPMVAWLGGPPVLLLPDGLARSLPADRRRALIAHELAHLKRRDHLVRHVELAVTVLLWWHPLAWLVRAGLREAEEQCCDAWVVRRFPDAREPLAQALVDAARALPTRAPAPLAAGLGQLDHLRRRITRIMEGSPRPTLSRPARVLALLALVTVPIVPAVAGDADNAALEARVADLEARLAAAEAKIGTAPVDLAAQQAAEKAKAARRAHADELTHSRAELEAAERLYQVANQRWGSAEAQRSLEEMVAKYPDLNRTGCALLYLGQNSEGAARAAYLDEAIAKHGDCFYLDGTQVGVYARYLRAMDLASAGDTATARRLFEEILALNPDGIDHSGQPIAPRVRAQLASLP